MKVILLEDTKGLGKKFDIKEVKDGYVRNFLLPKKLVQIATKTTLAQLKIQKESEQKAIAKLLGELEKIVDALKKEVLIFQLKVGDKGEVFGSVSVDKIIESLKAKGFEIKKEQIDLETPIKSLGEHVINIRLDREVKGTIKVKIEAED